MNKEVAMNERKASTILAEAIAKVVVMSAFVVGIVVVLGVCALLRDASAYRCWHRYWW